MSAHDEAAVRAVAAKVLAERVAAYRSQVNREALDGMGVEDKRIARLADGTKVGTITFKAGSTTAAVADERALCAWVAENYPHQVVTTQHVQPGFVKAILDASRAAGTPMAPDGTADVPGVFVGQGEPYASVLPYRPNLPALIGAVRANYELALQLAAPDDDGPAA